MYDPFRGATFAQVLDKIRKSIEETPRETILVYANPWEHKEVTKGGFFTLVDQLEGDWFTRMVNIYTAG